MHERVVMVAENLPFTGPYRERLEAAIRPDRLVSVAPQDGAQHAFLPAPQVSELRLEGGGIRVGEPLREFRGVLTGVPVYDGESSALLRKGKL